MGHLDFVAYVAVETDIEALRDRLVSALIYQKHKPGLIAALTKRIETLEALAQKDTPTHAV